MSRRQQRNSFVLFVSQGIYMAARFGVFTCSLSDSLLSLLLVIWLIIMIVSYLRSLYPPVIAMIVSLRWWWKPCMDITHASTHFLQSVPEDYSLQIHISTEYWPLALVEIVLCSRNLQKSSIFPHSLRSLILKGLFTFRCQQGDTTMCIRPGCADLNTHILDSGHNRCRHMASIRVKNNKVGITPGGVVLMCGWSARSTHTNVASWSIKAAPWQRYNMFDSLFGTFCIPIWRFWVLLKISPVSKAFRIQWLSSRRLHAWYRV